MSTHGSRGIARGCMDIASRTCMVHAHVYVYWMAVGKLGVLGFVANVVATVDSKEKEIISLYLSKGRILLTGHESIFKVWSCHSGKHDWSLLHQVSTPEKGSVTCICQFPDCDDKYAVSVNNCVAIYGIRSGAAPKLQHAFHFNSDEINQIDINPKGSFICAGDDSGEIKVIDVEKLCLYKTLNRQHSNICSTLKFNPRKPWEMFSGGLDCLLIRWDFSRGRPLFTVDVQTSDREGDKNSEEQTLKSYMVNPAMVHSIDVFRSTHSVVCGLGNGSVSVYSSLLPKKLEAVCSAPFHSTSVAFICCVETSNNHFIVSGGNDEKICVSRLVYNKKSTLVKPQQKQQSRLGQATGELDLIACIEHQSKINWMAVDTTCTDDTTKEDAQMLIMFVADQTSAVTVYEVKFGLNV